MADATLTMSIQTTLGAHSYASRALAMAHGLGLTAELHTGGGWFAKDHWFVVTGDAAKVRLWRDEIDSWIRAHEIPEAS